MSEIELSPEAQAAAEPSLDPGLLDALDVVLSLDAFAQFAHFGQRLRTPDELIARLEFEAVRCTRAGDGFSAAHRHDLAAGERERAARLRSLAASLRALFALVLARKRPR
ncbi:MAG: hypothetical protein U0269_30450 [Polyangiales bacterium]